MCSQAQHGFSFDNYSGIYGVVTNPANSVDSKFDIHVNVLSYNQSGISDIGGLSTFQIETAPNGFNGLEFSKNLMKGKTDGYAFNHSDILLPSIVWNFHENFGAGLLIRSRSFFDYNDVDSGLLQGVNSGLADEPFEFDNGDLNSTAQSWTEFGLNLSAVVINTNYHFVKFGGTFKYYMGKGGNEVRGPLNGSYDGSDLILNTVTDKRLVSLNTFPEENNGQGAKSFLASAFDFSGKGSGFGGDIGLVYEWRPRETNRVDVRSNNSAVNKYKLKISAAVLDLGYIKYDQARRDLISVTGLSLNSNSFDTNTGLINSIKNQNVSTFVDVDPSDGEATFVMPSSLNLNVDYIVLNDNNYYININYVKGLTAAADEFANTQRDFITLTPRYETRKFSVFLPVNFEATSGISAGLGVRYGPVTVGSAALSSMFTEGKIQHLYFGLSIPLMKELFR